jgi:hypothetical protein
MAVMYNYPARYVCVEVVNLNIVDKTISGDCRISRLENLNTFHPHLIKNKSFLSSDALRFSEQCEPPSASMAIIRLGIATSIL